MLQGMSPSRGMVWCGIGLAARRWAQDMFPVRGEAYARLKWVCAHDDTGTARM